MSYLDRKELLKRTFDLIYGGGSVAFIGSGPLFDLLLLQFWDAVPLLSDVLLCAPINPDDKLFISLVCGGSLNVVNVEDAPRIRFLKRHMEKKQGLDLLLVVEDYPGEHKELYYDQFMNLMLLKENARVQFLRF